ncbi:prepilin peptidase [Streptomyces griseiscabiei]|uniref:A24 family peptidase n=1 Tax=Streptomyces griseiscabiei TaxID=2993540 RepID=A0ABU4LEN8_9ACTN|nr:A24 family peptidase [Streptomyces griseiscabiei]MBZ3907243.1 prepilin peptidase [Streptomyces griseiscabiei]MDX2914255.1 A24 family peptidase [Streptomyces griseiscabiei]
MALDPWLTALTLAAALWGAATGTLLPRPAYRFTVDEDHPWRRECPAGHPLTGTANGWLGPARCQEPPACAYGPHTPAVATTTALVCAALALATGTRPELAVWLLLAPLGVLLTLVDLRAQRLPDPLTLPFAGLALTLLGAVAFVPEHAGQWRTAVYGALALGGLYFLFFLIRPAALGFGDVKLALGLGAVLGWYGWGALYLGTFAGALIGSVYTLVLAARGRAVRGQLIALGPFMITGAFTGLLLEAYAA